MPNGFITLTLTSTPQEQEADFSVDHIESYIPNPINPNGGSTLTMDSTAMFYVAEKVEQIRALIAAEKGTS